MGRRGKEGRKRGGEEDGRGGRGEGMGRWGVDACRAENRVVGGALCDEVWGWAIPRLYRYTAISERNNITI